MKVKVTYEFDLPEEQEEYDSLYYHTKNASKVFYIEHNAKRDFEAMIETGKDPIEAFERILDNL